MYPLADVLSTLCDDIHSTAQAVFQLVCWRFCRCRVDGAEQAGPSNLVGKLHSSVSTIRPGAAQPPRLTHTLHFLEK